MLLRPGASHAAALPGSLSKAPYLDAWIRIDADGRISVFTGKAELGQGIKTAIVQVAAEELKVEPVQIKLVTADTQLTANEQYTAGSHSLQDSGTAVRNAAAQVREILVGRAAERLALSKDRLRVARGIISADDGRALNYGQLVEGDILHIEALPTSPLTPPDRFTQMGKSLPRIDIPAKVTGGAAYVQDMRLPGMVHARVVRPPSSGATLLGADTGAVSHMPGVLSVIHDGDYLAVIASEEFQAVQAMHRLAQLARWQEQSRLPPQSQLAAYLKGLEAEDAVVIDQRSPVASAGSRMLEAQFTRAYQCHGSIGPSCALALLKYGALTVWTHTQGVFPDRSAIAEMLHMPKEAVRCIHVEGSGCYGHNGADDAAADAALLAHALPGTPVRVQWMREQEHLNEPYGPAMVTRARAVFDADGVIGDWQYELWSNTHGTRPGPAGTLLPERLLSAAFTPRPQQVHISPEGSGDRNAVPSYSFANKRVIWHFLKHMPLRVSSLRSLGAYMNVFSIESFMDEIAAVAQIDPVEFRLRQLDDPRSRDVVTLAAQRFGWGKRTIAPNHGIGFAFARYKNLASYCAVACEVAVEPDTGDVRLLHATCAIDSGEIVNPDGIRNQTEGGLLQSMSWTLFEAVQFDQTRVTSADWATYPILRFAHVPDSIEIHVIPRPGQPFLGAGEAAQGPAAGALGNAVANAIGARIRDIPFTRARVKAAMSR
ncbi:MAG TPA: molybdopterin cofactor-binding domain-containing protein [Steroidobacteraceae bacterium]|nr:molybdopterin cofactor-binding domain-containing protein [Steroidobacteraceae bacterium]